MYILYIFACIVCYVQCTRITDLWDLHMWKCGRYHQKRMPVLYEGELAMDDTVHGAGKIYAYLKPIHTLMVATHTHTSFARGKMTRLHHITAIADHIRKYAYIIIICTEYILLIHSYIYIYIWWKHLWKYVKSNKNILFDVIWFQRIFSINYWVVPFRDYIAEIFADYCCCYRCRCRHWYAFTTWHCFRHISVVRASDVWMDRFATE